jgi:hypothetical protein
MALVAVAFAEIRRPKRLGRKLVIDELGVTGG